jgi:hypothetical protein
MTHLHRKHALPLCKVLRTVPFEVALLAIIGWKVEKYKSESVEGPKPQQPEIHRDEGKPEEAENREWVASETDSDKTR